MKCVEYASRLTHGSCLVVRKHHHQSKTTFRYDSVVIIYARWRK